MPQSQDVRESHLPDDEEMAWLPAVAAGDQAAMALLYDRTSALVYGLGLRMRRDPVVAEDVTLEVYLQAWRQASQYDPQRGTLMAWLFTIARSRALDRLRAGSQRQQREQPLEAAFHLPDTHPGPEETSAVNQAQRLVQEALQSLAPEQREVIELAYFAGLSHRDIASVLAQPLGTIKTRIRLGMLHLRARLLPVVEG